MRPWFKKSEIILRLPSRSPEAYLAATVLVVIASLARWGLYFVGQPLLPFTTYYPAILFATYIGGFSVGCYAAILAGLIGWWAFLPPHLAFFVLKPKVGLKSPDLHDGQRVHYLGANSYRKLARNHRDVAVQLLNEEKLRKVAVEELAHRLKNKIATTETDCSVTSFANIPNSGTQLWIGLSRYREPTTSLWRRRDKGLIFAASWKQN